jgi:hypothetical protein
VWCDLELGFGLGWVGELVGELVLVSVYLWTIHSFPRSPFPSLPPPLLLSSSMLEPSVIRLSNSF